MPLIILCRKIFFYWSFSLLDITYIQPRTSIKRIEGNKLKIVRGFKETFYWCCFNVQLVLHSECTVLINIVNHCIVFLISRIYSSNIPSHSFAWISGDLKENNELIQWFNKLWIRRIFRRCLNDQPDGEWILCCIFISVSK